MMTPRFVVLTVMVFVAALSRIVPHPPNFTPLIAVALFGGTYFQSKSEAYAVPLLAMILSDLALASMKGYAFFTPMRLVIYGCFAAIVSMGFLLRNKSTVLTVVSGSLAGSLFFFFVSNLAVWLSSNWYPMTTEGLIACYIAAIPFFRNMVLSAVLYSALLFGGFELAKHRFPKILGARV